MLMYVLNTAWTGRIFCLNNNICFCDNCFRLGRVAKVENSANTICFLVSNVLLGYPKIGMATFTLKREGVDAKMLTI